MCGINGIILKKPCISEESIRDILNKMQKTMIHRGPDGEGTFFKDGVGVGMRRLSINGIETGNQPLYNEDKKILLIANGEIYNYLELNQFLESKSHQIRTGSDCESIIHLYEEYGIDAINYLRGMFAFCLIDLKKNEIYIARDRLGEKPLYFFEDESFFLFSSEMKSLMASGMVAKVLNPEAIFRYFHFQFIPEPLTPFKFVKKLKPGYFFKINLNNRTIQEFEYWSISKIQPKEGNPIELIREELNDISRLIFRSEAPLGIALSGGLDSSIVAALAKKSNIGNLKAITIGYEGSHESDERKDAIEFANYLDIPIETVELSTEDFVQNFSEMNFFRDDPIADISGFGYFRINSTAKALGLKVLVQGQGGDELFWGYPWVRESAEIMESRDSNKSLFDHIKDSAISSIPRSRVDFFKWVRSFFRIRGIFLGGFKKWKENNKILFYQNSPDFQWMLHNSEIYLNEQFNSSLETKELLKSFSFEEGDNNTGAFITRLIMETYLLENGIAQGDRLSMANNIEMRLPLIDYKLVELVLGLRKNPENKFDYRNSPKYWLKEATKELIPDFVRNRKKRGFTPPVSLWHKELFKKYGTSLIDGPLLRTNVFNRTQLLELSKGPFPSGTISPLSFKTLVLNNWLENFI